MSPRAIVLCRCEYPCRLHGFTLIFLDLGQFVSKGAR
jgi:hypothetical protein